MNKYYTFALILITSLSYAQIVNIPDPNFKNALLTHEPVIDTNNDGEIQYSEAEATIALWAFNSGINDLTGLEAFINLEEIYCSSNNISNIDTSYFPLLEVLSCIGNNLTSIDVSQNPYLRYFFCSSNDISEIDISSNPNLLRIDFGNTLIQELNLENNNDLELIRLYRAILNTIDVSNLAALKTLEIGFNPISEIDLSNNSNLEYFSAYSTNLTELNIENNAQLLMLIIAFTDITSLDVSSNLDLRLLDFGATLIPDMDVSILEDLQWIDFSGTLTPSIDLSNSYNLCKVNGGYSNDLEYINLRNGNNIILQQENTCHVQSAHTGYSSPSSVFLFQSFNLEFICVDDIPFAEEHFIEIPPGTELIEECLLSISENQSKDLKLYPNPSSTTFTVESETLMASITVMNSLGQTLLELKPNSTIEHIDISEFSAGSYLVRVTVGTNSSVYHLLKK